MITVSVVLSTHNRADLLIDAIKSVSEQSVKDLEILVCDDSSTDNTKEIVADMQKKDVRIKYLCTPHNIGYPSVPRNMGIAIATGKWVAFLDDDDRWLANKLEKQITFMGDNKLKACSANAISIPTEKLLLNYDKDRISFMDLMKANYVIQSSLIVESRIAKLTGFPEQAEYKAFEDYAFNVLITDYTKIGYIKDPLIYYTENSNTSIRINSEHKFEKQRLLVLKNYAKKSRRLPFLKQKISINQK